MSGQAYRAEELASRFGLQVHGDGNVVVHGVATLANATTGTLAFLANPRYRGQLAQSQAGVVVMGADDASDYPRTALLAKDPYAAFA